jgi:hypothetical protein
VVDPPRALGREDDPPAVLQPVGRRDFRVHVFARLERLRRERPLLLAAHGEGHRVDVGIAQHFAVVGVDLHLTRLFEAGDRRLVQRHDRVTDGGDAVARQPLEQREPGPRPAAPQADDGDADLFHGRPPP